MYSCSCRRNGVERTEFVSCMLKLAADMLISTKQDERVSKMPPKCLRKCLIKKIADDEVEG